MSIGESGEIRREDGPFPNRYTFYRLKSVERGKMFKKNVGSFNETVLLQPGRDVRRPRGRRKALKIAASVGAGAGTVALAFVMTWIMTL